MKIGGLLKFSIIDFPGKLAAVIFTQGCNFRCPYCHNAELVLPDKFQPPVPVQTVLDFLTKRRGQLNGVVVSGGEPTMHPDLKPFLQQIKALDYAVKLDTNGTRPDVLIELAQAGLLDYIAMDIKAPLEKYHQLTGATGLEAQIKKSIQWLINQPLPYEFRTTVLKDLLTEKDLQGIFALIKGAGCYRLQDFVPRDSVVDPAYADEAMDQYTEKQMQVFRAKYELPHSSGPEQEKNEK
jgi:pyruvate formate lyase activating enzyme